MVKQTRDEFNKSLTELVEYCTTNSLKSGEVDFDELYGMYITDSEYFGASLLFPMVPDDDIEFAFLRIKAPNNNFSFLNGHNEFVKDFIVNICLYNNYLSTIYCDFNEYITKINNVDDILSIIKIIHENKIFHVSNEELDKITDEDLNKIIIDDVVKESEKSNNNKMTKLYNLFINRQSVGDFYLGFKFKDKGKCFEIHSFILTDSHFEKVINILEANSTTLSIDEKYTNEICNEIVKYLYTGNISQEISEKSLLILKEVGHKYQLKLEDICISRLSLNNKLRIEELNVFEMVLASEKNKYPIYSVKYKDVYFVIAKVEDKMYYLGEISNLNEINEMVEFIYVNNHNKIKFLNDNGVTIDKNKLGELNLTKTGYASLYYLI